MAVILNVLNRLRRKLIAHECRAGRDLPIDIRVRVWRVKSGAKILKKN